MPLIEFMRKSLLLLHGALGSAKQLDPIKNNLSERYNVYSFDFIGHGGTAIPEKILMNDLVDQLEHFIKTTIPVEDELTIFGYSMGGYAALMLAAEGSCKIEKIITLGTKLLWTPEIASYEVKMLDPAIIEEKVPAFAKELSERHLPADWKVLLKKTVDLLLDLGTNQYLIDEVYAQINVPCKLMLGDKDSMVTFEETIYARARIKGASLSIMPATSHPIEKVDLKRLLFEINY